MFLEREFSEDHLKLVKINALNTIIAGGWKGFIEHVRKI